MTALADLVNDRLRTLGWQRKQLAHEWRERAGANGAISTFETRLSKLMTGDGEGYRFALNEEGGKLGALAAVLDIDEPALRALMETSRDRLTLVLSPLLDEGIKAFFEKRASLSQGTFEVVMPEATDDRALMRESLRDHARRSRNAVVVVPDGDRDHDFFEGAGVKTSRVETARPGFRLVALPELVPALPPRTHDPDGMPMVLMPDREIRYRDLMKRQAERQRGYPVHPVEAQEGERWVARIREADAEGTAVTFRFDWIENRPTSEELRDAILGRATEALIPRGNGTTSSAARLWTHENRLLSLGTPADPYSVRDHHRVHDVASLEPLVAAVRKILEGLNPWRDGGEFDLRAELDAFHKETGIAVELGTAALRGALKPLRDLPESRSVGTTARRSADDDCRLRVLLDELLTREFILVPTRVHVRHGEASVDSIMFRLEAIRDASLMHYTVDPGTMVLANVGAGRVLYVSTRKYSEPPAAVRCENIGSGFVLDGGDVRILITDGFDAALEGTVLRSVGRRREEEAAPARRDDDDD